ncbi:MAG: hypothetical protein VX667_02025 [Nitrospinota bacterium]|nr:hypothetical protein [Nitrospinota bacterium]
MKKIFTFSILVILTAVIAGGTLGCATDDKPGTYKKSSSKEEKKEEGSGY